MIQTEIPVSAIIPMRDAVSRVGEHALYFLNQHGFQVEDILLESIALVLTYPFMISRLDLDNVMDTAGLDALWDAAHDPVGGNAGNYHQFRKFAIDALWEFYSTNYQYLWQMFGMYYRENQRPTVSYSKEPRVLGNNNDGLVSLVISF